MMRRSAAMGAVLVLWAGAAGAAGAAVPGAEPTGRTVTVTVYGSDPCPKARDGEVVVCGRRPDNERYRIPKELRKKGERPSETSWASRAQALEEASRAGRPNSCSPVGTNGQTGCFQQMLRQWYWERKQAKSDAASQP
jgi:hypothetical protein